MAAYCPIKRFMQTLYQKKIQDDYTEHKKKIEYEFMKNLFLRPYLLVSFAFQFSPQRKEELVHGSLFSALPFQKIYGTFITKKYSR